MYIGSVIKPRPPAVSRSYDVLGVVYKFVDLGSDGHFVCDVTDEEHARILLEHPEKAFYKHDAKIDLKRGTVTTPPPAPEDEAAVAAAAEAKRVADEAQAVANRSAALAEFSAEVRAEAAELLLVAPNKLGQAVGKVSTPVVIRAARLLEDERKDGARTSVVELLDRTLKLMQDAGKGA